MRDPARSRGNKRVCLNMAWYCKNLTLEQNPIGNVLFVRKMSERPNYESLRRARWPLIPPLSRMTKVIVEDADLKGF
jgi:hypothetical protein